MHWLQAAEVPGQVAVLLQYPRPRPPAEEGGAAVLGEPGAPAEPAHLQPPEAGRCQGWAGGAVNRIPEIFAFTDSKKTLCSWTVFALAVMENAVGVSKFGKNPMTLLVHQY